MMTFEIVRNSGRTLIESTNGRLRLHVGRTGLSRVSHTAGGSALYAGQNIGIPLTEESMAVPSSDPTTGDLASDSAEVRGTPLISGILERLTGLPARSFSTMRAWSSRPNQSKTTRASRNS